MPPNQSPIMAICGLLQSRYSIRGRQQSALDSGRTSKSKHLSFEKIYRCWHGLCPVGIMNRIIGQTQTEVIKTHSFKSIVKFGIAATFLFTTGCVVPGYPYSYYPSPVGTVVPPAPVVGSPTYCYATPPVYPAPAINIAPLYGWSCGWGGYRGCYGGWGGYRYRGGGYCGWRH